ncbi:MAG TPA: phosphoenolpyruvate kinase [Thermoanaerobaculia bacterium]|nr:phosphoenolpyruvate kinase [Thermoanaerobaculia bacterium]
MRRSLTPELTREIDGRLARANADFAARYPGDSPERQPVHTVYGGAHLFRSDTAPRMGALARASLEKNAPDAATFASALGLPAAFAGDVHALVVRKLETEPVEDFRIDFEDGYGNRPDVEEDGHAESAAREVAKGREGGTLPPFIGLRIKPFTEELRARSVRTLDVFLTTLLEGGAPLPSGFRITLPKVTRAEQAAALGDLLGLLEPRLSLAEGSLLFEIMVETPQSILDADGRVVLPQLVAAGRGRCVSAHFGTYDYTAGLNITAAHQTMTHPACDFAKHAMQVALAGTGVTLSDGATNVMPVGDRASVHRAWKLHYDHVRHSLEGAFYQGWDLHPAQLPTRYAAVFAFFLESAGAAKERLGNFVAKSAQATLVGDVFDDAATGQGLLNFFLRGISCGAIAEEDVLATGLTLEELRGRSFVKILRNRRGDEPI